MSDYYEFKDHRIEITGEKEDYVNDDCTKKKENYRIKISQDGKFAVTFDTANLRIKILQNTDYRRFIFDKEKKVNYSNKNEDEGSIEIDKAIAYFKIKDDLTVDYLYDINYKPRPFVDNDVSPSDNDRKTTRNKNSDSKENKENDKFRWSFDILNMYKNDNRYFILIAISCININEDMMKGTDENIKDNDKSKFKYSPQPSVYEDKDASIDVSLESKSDETPERDDESKKGIAIYRIELNKSIVDEGMNGIYVLNDVTRRCYYNNISGICKFIEDSSEDNKNKSHDIKLRRFIILNFRGIHNFEFSNNYDTFKLGEKFEYPQIIKRKLNNWYTDTNNGCMKILLSCISDKYFLVTRYKKGFQILEVYNLAEMGLETTAKRSVKEDELYNFVNRNIFTINRSQLCFTRGTNIVNLYHMENGLQIALKIFNEIERILFLEFIDSDEKLLIIGKEPGSEKDQEEDKKELKFLIWDLYKTDKVESIKIDNFSIDNIKNFDARLTKTSGNILQIDHCGNVSSVLKKVELKLKGEKIKEKEKKYLAPIDNFPDLEPIINVNNIEPWVKEKFERKTFTLYHCKKGTKKEILQVIVGRSTIQIWHQIKDSKNKDNLPNKGEPFLEYIWTSRTPLYQAGEKTKLRVERLERGLNDDVHDKLTDFYLKVYWYERKNKEKLEEDNEIDKIEEDLKKINEKDIDENEKENQRREVINKVNNDNNSKVKILENIIERKHIIGKFRAVKHACKALEHLNKRCKKQGLVDSYTRSRNYEELITYIKLIVWKFVKHEPQNFKLLDVRHDIMKSLILSDCDDLIKYVLFGNEEAIGNKIVHNELRHIPSNKPWPSKKFLRDDDLDFDKRLIKDNNVAKPENNMELAIYHCKGREAKDTAIVAYLLEYYSRNATDCAGWMCTVSKAIPLLFKYNYDDYTEKLFFKECFVGQTQESVEIIPTEHLTSHDHTKFRAFGIDKLRSNKCKNQEFEFVKPVALRVVPLPCFTINEIIDEKEEYNFYNIIFNIILFLFIPRWYKICRNDENKLSPFSRMVLYGNDVIYDNPAIEAVINFRWQKSRNFYYFLFLRFFVFATCFALVSWSYLDHSIIINQTFLFILIIIFYYLAIYLFATEVSQFLYHGYKRYLNDIFNFLDIISITFAVTIMSIMLKDFQVSDGFASAKEIDTGLNVWISFSVFLVWIELIFYFRLIPYVGIYIYYVNIIIKTIFPFILFMSVVILAFAHTMFVLLRNPVNIKTNDSTYSGVATNSLTNETLDVKLKADFDPKSSDNPFTSFSRAIMATYFWTSDEWVQKDEFDFWAVDLYTCIGSIFLVIILQNMLIAFMSGVYQEVTDKSRQILLKYQANHIANYEALYPLHLWKPEPEPKYIYYLGRPQNYEDWCNIRKDDNKSAICKDFEKKSTFAKFIFKEKDFDRFSIWDYHNYDDDNIKMSIENFKSVNNDFSNNIEYLIRRFKDKNSIGGINDVNKLWDNEFEKFQLKLEKLKTDLKG
ncbi:hypothetical protein RclHR1_17200003 [Rhizophagus clarus]|uniref:Ion transport domain-containing protein n=1 Tax=Rhizophagus clarus TaxID=94130 RepID=A0A2Z6R035_9GLOM|nr:hypothetical protein RclHR1_17200003 [Rhizophagus clarus]GES84512.1 hypothetical protein GLOIN_2v1769896 [Rhizophagus clarus]